MINKFQKIASRSKKRIEEYKVYGQNDMFIELWNASNKKSVISGRDLSNLEVDSNLWRCCFAHVLPKGKYPLYRLNKNNVLIVAPEEHSLLDQGTVEQREKYKQKWFSKGYEVKWEVFYDLKEELKKKYPEF